jgi:antitoxin (DNA-binding transcriptional repressor) of toxin-antitoxin stability system
MDNSKIMSATEASRSFSELLHRVCYGGESFVIKKGQRLMARIIPVEEVQREAISAAPITAINDAAVVKEIFPEETLPLGMTPDEAEFYRAWMEQVRKVEA